MQQESKRFLPEAFQSIVLPLDFTQANRGETVTSLFMKFYFRLKSGEHEAAN